MKQMIVFLLICLFLNSCQMTPESDIKTENNTLESDNDEYYLKIAKELYVARQYKQAYQITSNLAEKNNVEAQYLLGYLLYYGQGVPADIELGTRWIEKSADIGYRPAIEALVMIHHGLTPDNKCPSVKQIPMHINVAEKKVDDNKIDEKPRKIESTSGMTLKDGEVLITPGGQKKKTSMDIPMNTKQSGSNRDHYTIQLIHSVSEKFVKDYMTAFKQQYPDLGELIISYKSKFKPNSYGVGFDTYQTRKEAETSLLKLQNKLNDASIWIKPLKKSVLINI